MAEKQYLVANNFKYVWRGVLLALMLGACGGGGGSDRPAPPPPGPPPPPPPPPPTVQEAFKFLNQTTFGATEAAATDVIDVGYEEWIDDQIALPVSLQEPYLRSLPVPAVMNELQVDRVDIWFRHALAGEDQLRQRIAFALSEILVVSQIGALNRAPYTLADYYDLLARHAFGNYRELLEEVTLHPAMGVYLSMLGNEQPNPTLNIRPDENYARELMQLFSIGLVELAPDGSVLLDPNGDPIPTYDQEIIEGFAHVFTGWHWAGFTDFTQASPNLTNVTLPMQLYPAFHDDGEKLLLGGVVLPAGQTGQEDLAAALDNIFAHSNVGPFVSYRLIQRLVTSNPSPAYVERVASVFDDNGFGERGDLRAVVKAILLDDEARGEQGSTIGKVKEPLLRLTQLWRAYDAQAQSGKYIFPFGNFVLGQGPLQAPSVFNFFSPSFAPFGEIADAGLVAPELQIATEFQNTFTTNYLFDQAFVRTTQNQELDEDAIFIDIEEEVALATDLDAVIDRVADKLLAGEISSTLRTEIRGMLERVDDDQAALRASETVYLIVTSPEFAYQR